VLIALDREERGQGDKSAVQEVQDTFGLPVVSVLRLRDLMDHLQATGEAATLAAVRAYRDRYGV
jgi:orotate phosphoribosyltransferase